MRFPVLREEDGSAVRGICDLCGREIYRRETFYRVDGENICEECVEDYARRMLAPFREEGDE